MSRASIDRSSLQALAARALALCAMLCLPLFLPPSQTAQAEPNDPSYVIFTIMGPQALSSQVTEITVPEAVWNARESSAVEEMRKEFGEQHHDRERYIGFSVALMPTLNLESDQLKRQVVFALDLAERNNIPLFFHLDDQHFWWMSPELSHDPDMIEWSDFPKAGEMRGPSVPRYWLAWGEPPGVYPAPPPCFACPAFRAAISKRLKDCVAEPIVERLHVWKRQGREYLFAGVAAGNETQVPDYSRGYDGYKGKAGEARGLDRTRNPAAAVRMTKADTVPSGYHSLYAMGYNRQSLERLAKARGTTVKKTVEEIFFKVAHDYSELQAKILNDAGIARERIYTHFTSTARTLPGFDDRPPTSDRTGSDNLPPPISASLNRYSRPGFTVVRDGVDLNELSKQLREVDAGKAAWAAVESYACSRQPGTPMTKEQYEEYLGGLFGHGARVVNVYGWNVPAPNPFAVKGSAVIPVVKKWLAGEHLPPSWCRSQAHQTVDRIRAKMAKLQESARQAVSRGCDPRNVSGIVESFQREFEPLVKAERLPEAEACLDRAIARLKAP